jgi:hypothetical protein
MSENLNYQQLIDDYLSGNITIQDKAVVEHKLATDPGFRNEFDLQKNVINAIRNTRRLELKSRMENIQVHWYHSIPQSWKIAATVSVATLTTISAYFYFNPDILTGVKTDLESAAPVETIVEENNIPQKPSVEIESVPEIIPDTAIEPAEKPAERISDNPTARAEETVKTPVVAAEHEAESSVPETSHDIEVVVPDMEDDLADAPDLNMDELSSDNLNKLNPVREDLYSTTEVKTIRHKKYNFHYELRDGMLTLYGNFEEIPYEILEINSADGKRLFLNYRNNYYMLTNTYEIAPLNPVTDTTLIKELDIVKDNK